MSKAGYTSHGHEIPGASVYPPERPKVYRCGGPGLCEVCSRESAAWQAEQDRLDESEIAKVAAQRAVKIAELEAELDGIKSRDAEVGEDESWWIGGAWGDYGEAVVPLRILSYVIDGNLDEKIASTDPGFALTYAEQRERAEKAEAKLDEIRELCAERVSGYPDDPYDFVREFSLRVLAILDGEQDGSESNA